MLVHGIIIITTLKRTAQKPYPDKSDFALSFVIICVVVVFATLCVHRFGSIRGGGRRFECNFVSILQRSTDVYVCACVYICSIYE